MTRLVALVVTLGCWSSSLASTPECGTEKGTV